MNLAKTSNSASYLNMTVHLTRAAFADERAIHYDGEATIRFELIFNFRCRISTVEFVHATTVEFVHAATVVFVHAATVRPVDATVDAADLLGQQE